MQEEKNYKVLIVDDEADFHVMVRNAFRQRYEFEGARSLETMWAKLKENTEYDLLILDLIFDDSTEEKIGMFQIKPLREKYPRLPIVVATKDKDPDTVMLALEEGAAGFISKNFIDQNKWNEKFIKAIESESKTKELAQERKEKERLQKAYKQNQEKIQLLESEKYSFVGDSPEINKIKKRLQAFAYEPNATVLLTGETGVGKEVAARYFHKKGPRADMPFVAVNFGAEPREDLLFSRLFGQRKGSYTGAENTLGFFEQAEGGILFFDEIGEITPQIQVALLRFLEDREFTPLGAQKPMVADIQIITATNRNLDAEIKNGRFRLDLYQRLKKWSVELPPLRTRTSDVLQIIEHYVHMQLPHVKIFELFEQSVLDHLMHYAWPGNIRELRNALDSMLLDMRLEGKDSVDWDCVPADIMSDKRVHESTNELKVDERPQHKNKKYRDAEMDLAKISQALVETGGNKTKAAELAGYNGSDHMRARVHTCHKNFPTMLDLFPQILEHYGKGLK